MMNKQRVNEWLNDYVNAWKSYDPAAIGALFSQNAGYRYNPFDEPVRGREAIIANWLEYRDPPNTFAAEYHPIAVDDNLAVVNGRTQYYEADGKTLKRHYDNIFVLQFDEAGQCVDFCEWFMQPRKS